MRAECRTVVGRGDGSVVAGRAMAVYYGVVGTVTVL